MAIQYVGGVAVGRTGNSNATTTQSLTSLTGGIGTQPAENDLVIVCCAVGSRGRNTAQAISGYSTLGTQLNTTAVTYDSSMQVSYKKMTSTPDTSITIPAQGNIADGQAWAVMVFRNVDTTTPFDVSSVSASGTGTGRPNPGQITPSTAGSWIVCAAASAAAATTTAFTFPSDLSDDALQATGADTNDARASLAYHDGWTSGAYDPAAYTGGTTGANDSWTAWTMALRPAVLTYSGSGTPTLPLITSSGAVKAIGPGGGEASPLPHLNSLFAASGTTFSGSGSPSLPLLTATGAGTKARKGTGTATLPLVTATGAGTKARKGSGTPSLPLLTATGSGKKTRPGSGTPSLPLITSSGSGSVAAADEWVGSGTPSLPLLTASGAAKRGLKSTGSPSLPLVTASGSGTKTRKGSGTPSLPLLTASGAGKKARSGSGTVTLPLITASGSGASGITGGGGDPAPFPHLGLLLAPSTSDEGSGAANLPLITASGSGQVVALPVSSIQTISKRNRPGRGPYSLGSYYRPPLRGSFVPVVSTTKEGSGSVNLPLLTASGSGTKARKGAGAATLPLVTSSGAGKKERKGTGTPSLPLLTASGSGSSAEDVYSGSGAGTLPLLTASGTGTKSRKGSGTPSLPLITASGSGKKARSGTGSSDLPLITASGSGAVTEAGTFSGSGSASLPLVTASGSAKRALKATGAASLPLVTASGTGKRALLGSGSATLPVVTSSGAGTGPQEAEPPRDPMLGGGPTRDERKKFKDWLKGLRTHTGSGKSALPVLTASGEGLVVRKISEPFKTSEEVRRPLLRLPQRKKVEVPADIDAQIAAELKYAEELETQKRKRRRKQDEEILLLM